MNDDQKILRIFIDGKWTAHDWSEMLDAVDEVYSIFALLYLMNNLDLRKNIVGAEPFAISERIKQLKEILLADEPYGARDFIRSDQFALEKSLDLHPPMVLQVFAVKYGSEGSWDLLGLGKSLDAVQKFFKNTMDFFAGKPERKKQELENLGTALKIADQAGFSEEERQKIVRKKLRKLGYAVEKGVEQNRLPKPPEIQRLPPPKST